MGNAGGSDCIVLMQALLSLEVIHLLVSKASVRKQACAQCESEVFASTSLLQSYKALLEHMSIAAPAPAPN